MDSSKTRQKNKKEEYMGNSIMKASDRMSAEQQVLHKAQTDGGHQEEGKYEKRRYQKFDAIFQKMEKLRTF